MILENRSAERIKHIALAGFFIACIAILLLSVTYTSGDLYITLRLVLDDKPPLQVIVKRCERIRNVAPAAGPFGPVVTELLNVHVTAYEFPIPVRYDWKCENFVGHTIHILASDVTSKYIILLQRDGFWSRLGATEHGTILPIIVIFVFSGLLIRTLFILAGMWLVSKYVIAKQLKNASDKLSVAIFISEYISAIAFCFTFICFMVLMVALFCYALLKIESSDRFLFGILVISALVALISPAPNKMFNFIVRLRNDSKNWFRLVIVLRNMLAAVAFVMWGLHALHFASAPDISRVKDMSELLIEFAQSIIQ